jgi:hypothetical protein
LNDGIASARRVLEHIIEATESSDPVQSPPTPPDTRNAAAVALGMLGASKGGKARAKALSKVERANIARLAARARWTDKD